MDQYTQDATDLTASLRTSRAEFGDASVEARSWNLAVVAARIRAAATTAAAIHVIGSRENAGTRDDAAPNSARPMGHDATGGAP